MAVPYPRVTDAYGGYFGSASPTLPASAPKPATPATTTTAAKNNTTAAAKTMRMLAANTTNATAKPAEYKLNLFIQPDPFAKSVDNAATVTLATGTAALAAVDSVTKATYGAMTAKAATVTEAKVGWTKKPAATGGAKMITISGSVDAAAYVYCGVNKAKSSRRRMLNATANSTNKTTTTTTAAKPAVVITNL